MISNGQILRAAFDTVAEVLQRRGLRHRRPRGFVPGHRPLRLRPGLRRVSRGVRRAAGGVAQVGGARGARRPLLLPGGDDHRRALAMIDSWRLDPDTEGGGEGDGRSQFPWFHYFDPHDPYGDSDRTGEAYYPVPGLPGPGGRARPGAALLPASGAATRPTSPSSTSSSNASSPASRPTRTATGRSWWWPRTTGRASAKRARSPTACGSPTSRSTCPW